MHVRAPARVQSLSTGSPVHCSRQGALLSCARRVGESGRACVLPLLKRFMFRDNPVTILSWQLKWGYSCRPRMQIQWCRGVKLKIFRGFCARGPIRRQLLLPLLWRELPEFKHCERPYARDVSCENPHETTIAAWGGTEHKDNSCICIVFFLLAESDLWMVIWNSEKQLFLWKHWQNSGGQLQIGDRNS